ncbi:uncharacterized protein ASCRUDRAFT_77146 [Ascoidea rubescens DSM 1968]|uniref:Uncharacterized protein n=1 Tax=Ascoidea rubescens DSM 1968 TaxID=1344418 RepID=A0A1D2VCN9_9ASCO|nr:hypothetical protein ASCRUDRAFT_77146 [Ascoidea rubescens DSM 1968]ODV59406.1 hypothetical protein ASCRUDRAFT_77146 [Ascoidea rubescens DSM 1968]
MESFLVLNNFNHINCLSDNNVSYDSMNVNLDTNNNIANNVNITNNSLNANFQRERSKIVSQLSNRLKLLDYKLNYISCELKDNNEFINNLNDLDDDLKEFINQFRINIDEIKKISIRRNNSVPINIEVSQKRIVNKYKRLSLPLKLSNNNKNISKNKTQLKSEENKNNKPPHRRAYSRLSDGLHFPILSIVEDKNNDEHDKLSKTSNKEKIVSFDDNYVNSYSLKPYFEKEISSDNTLMIPKENYSVQKFETDYDNETKEMGDNESSDDSNNQLSPEELKIKLTKTFSKFIESTENKKKDKVKRKLNEKRFSRIANSERDNSFDLISELKNVLSFTNNTANGAADGVLSSMARESHKILDVSSDN